MLTTVGLPLAFAIVAAIIIGLFRRPRDYIWGKLKRVYWRMFLRRRERIDRAIDRLAEAVIQLRGDKYSMDNDFYLSLKAWFTGDPDAFPDYQAMNERVNERMKRGDQPYGDQSRIPQ